MGPVHGAPEANDVVIVSAVRTPIGRIRGVLSQVRPDDLAALAIKDAVRQAGVEPAMVEEVFMGCANQAGEDNRNVARMSLLLAGLPQQVAGLTVNRLCASGLAAVNMAARAIRCGEGEVIVAGGVESMTRAPYSVPKHPVGFGSGNLTGYDTTLGWRYPNAAMEKLFPLEPMGETAENLVQMARDGGLEGGEITREDQDRFALRSQERAVVAMNQGRFEAEIVPVPLPARKKGEEPVLVTRDEHPQCTWGAGGDAKVDTSLEKLATLRPVFRKGGTVTAGNASGLNDGACALVLMSRAKAKELGIPPLATWVCSATAGVDPRTMGIGPVPAIRKVLKRAGLGGIGDVDLAEVNEAFAAQALAVLRGVGLREEITNVNGGAIALGHPLGCSGARILTTLIHEMRRRAGAAPSQRMRYGLASLCVGVGQGEATLIRLEDAAAANARSSPSTGDGAAVAASSAAAPAPAGVKQVPVISTEEAARLVKPGSTMLVGGFGMTGNPVHLLHAIAEVPAIRDLTYVGNNVGEAGLGGGRLLRNGQLKGAIGSFFTSNKDAVQAAQSGTMEVELLPQGTLSEAIRAGGAGIGGFFTPTAAGTPLAKDRETRVIGGVEQIFQPALRGDVALLRAWRADTAGNLQYRMTEQNFNRAMATAADLVIAEVEKIVPCGGLDPDQIHTPGIYVDYLVEAHTTLEDLGSSASVVNAAAGSGEAKPKDPRREMALRALAELRPRDVVNLGVGIPTLVADLLTPEQSITLHTENGMLGVGPSPRQGGAMDYPVNAGKVPVTALPGSCYFDSAESFAMIRGGHVDVAIMGGLQVDEAGNLANWAVPGKPLLGVGGAMDLASGAKRLIVTMAHTEKDNTTSKVVPLCTLPLTVQGGVDTVITDLAVFKFPNGKLTLVDLMPGVNLEEVTAKTSAAFAVDFALGKKT